MAETGHAQWSSLLAAIADAADAIAMRYFRSGALKLSEKSDGSPTTSADLEIEQIARRIAGERSPGIGICGEEYGELRGTGATRLIVDPVDATHNFVRGIPIFATLLAIEADGEIVAGLVSAPALAARWSAARGGGAFRNGKPIHVSSIARLARAQLFHCGIEAMGVYRHAVFELAGRARRSRGFGDFYQDVLVAEGAGEIAVDFALEPWDIAALAVIVEEAGGRATSAQGERTIHAGSLVTSNGLLHDDVIQALAAGGAETTPG